MGNCQSKELSSQSLTLNPVLVTCRSCLPLAYLDLSGSTHGIPGTHFFGAHLHILEHTTEGGNHDQRILIAENCAVKASLYAIERVDAGLYTLCPLNGCATVKTLIQLQARASGIQSKKRRCCLRINPQDSGWWRDLAIKDRNKIQVDSFETEVKFPWNVRLCLQNQSPAETLSVANRAQLPAGTSQEPAPVISKGSSHSRDFPMQTPEDIFSMLSAQYQEALYFSKVKLPRFFQRGLVLMAADLSGLFCKRTFISRSSVFARQSYLVGRIVKANFIREIWYSVHCCDGQKI